MTPSHRLIGVMILLLSSMCEATGQLAFKQAATRQPDGHTGPRLGAHAAAFSNPGWLFLGWISFMLDGLFWSAALFYLDITVAHPIGSIVFVIVAIFSKLFLGEKLSARRWTGIAFILVGAAVVAMN